MEYTGLIQKYPIDRLLTEQEKQNQLKQKQRFDVQPVYQLSVIKMNSTFLEIADKYYGLKGVLATAGLASSAVMMAGYLAFTFILYWSPDSQQYAASDAAFVSVANALILGPLLAFLIWLLRKESFAYTHYPIRLNRKTRMIHVFRLNGTVLSVPWEKVFFTLGRGASPRQWDVRGHVLDADGVTVRESFALGAWSVGERGKEVLRRYWEFIRRYMEDGPQTAFSTVQICLPIAERKESLRNGFDRMFAEFSGAPFPVRVMGALIALAILPGRWFAIKTSKIPMWPQAVEDENRVEPGDPYVRDALANSQAPS
jgi:hypothetical protein